MLQCSVLNLHNTTYQLCIQWHLCNPSHAKQIDNAIYACNAFYSMYAMPIVHTIPLMQYKQCPLCMQCHLCSVHNAHCACNAICFVSQCQICKQCHSCRQYNANNAHNAICAHNTNFTGYSMPKVHAMPNVPHIWHRMLHNRNWIAAYLALTDSKLSWHSVLKQHWIVAAIMVGFAFNSLQIQSRRW